MRVANLVRFLNDVEPWVLVLPPWGRLYHWQSRSIDNYQIPWSMFFDLESIRQHIPVMEFTDYVKGRPSTECGLTYLSGFFFLNILNVILT